MVALYITSSERGSGKTAVCAGLGKHLLSDGKKTGFLKPVVADNKNAPAEGIDSDAAFMKHIFALEEPVEFLLPVFKDEGNLSKEIKEAYAKVSRGKDVVIIEGIYDKGKASHDVIEALDARVIIVEAYSAELPRTVDSYKGFEKRLLGTVLNKVPGRRMERVRDEISAQLDKAGVNILGVLPEDRTLFALTVGELAEHVRGEILSGAEKSAELVENVMLGAMSPDSGLEYFGRKANKAAVIRSERPDMQLAALETSTRCLVLAGDVEPKPVVLSQAEEKGIPIILAKDDTVAITANIEDALGKIRFNQENKLPRLAEIMRQHFDFQALYKGLGLAG